MPTTYNLVHSPTLGDYTKQSPHSTLFGTKKKFQIDESSKMVSEIGPQGLKDKMSIIKEEIRIFS